MEGALSKWTNVMKGWQYRWFVLDDDAGLFSYYTSREKMRRGVRRGCVRLRGALVGIDSEDDSTFTITVDNKTFHFQAKDSEERERWIRALEDTVVRHNQLARRALGHRGPYLRGREGQSQATIQDFELKLQETDCYLQLLISQSEELTSRLETIKNGEEGGVEAAPTPSPTPTLEGGEGAREVAGSVVGRVQDMVETVKHAIVLLQIAKNASSGSGGAEDDDSSGVTLEQGKEALGVQLQQHALLPEGGGGSEGHSQPSTSPPSVSKSLAATLKNTSIPVTSYSSSDDDDDDFFDAEESSVMSAAREAAAAARKPSVGEPGGTATPSDPESNAEFTPTVAPASVSIGLTESLAPDVDWDALYEDSPGESEAELDVKSHGSVITHLLSQVRIGMDLTKVTLPTFILEPRSLLEMYSNFFGHPDIFVAIAEKSSPEERIIQVLRWYLSSVSSSRNGNVCKKPYNPILGEIFQCHWPGVGPQPQGANTGEAALSWCQSQDLVFQAEQVSHHPPVSAFYCECPSAGVSLSAHIYTKSAFLGMSVAAHMLGEGRLTLHTLGEEYLVTFPSGYARNILATPWMELGGKCAISCEKTGYRADVEFKCKQFWGTEQNKVVADVFSSSSKKSVVRVEGEWTGRLVAKYQNRTDTFLDAPNLKKGTKVVRPVVSQDPNESRRLWREVTKGLRSGDIELATEAKFGLETRQRDEARQRKENGETWEQRMFSQVGERWRFKHPLESRQKAEL